MLGITHYESTRWICRSIAIWSHFIDEEKSEPENFCHNTNRRGSFDCNFVREKYRGFSLSPLDFHSFFVVSVPPKNEEDCGHHPIMPFIPGIMGDRSNSATRTTFGIGWGTFLERNKSFRISFASMVGLKSFSPNGGVIPENCDIRDVPWKRPERRLNAWKMGKSKSIFLLHPGFLSASSKKGEGMESNKSFFFLSCQQSLQVFSHLHLALKERPTPSRNFHPVPFHISEIPRRRKTNGMEKILNYQLSMSCRISELTLIQLVATKMLRYRKAYSQFRIPLWHHVSRPPCLKHG